MQRYCTGLTDICWSHWWCPWLKKSNCNEKNTCKWWRMIEGVHRDIKQGGWSNSILGYLISLDTLSLFLFFSEMCQMCQTLLNMRTMYRLYAYTWPWYVQNNLHSLQSAISVEALREYFGLGRGNCKCTCASGHRRIRNTKSSYGNTTLTGQYPISCSSLQSSSCTEAPFYKWLLIENGRRIRSGRKQFILWRKPFHVHVQRWYYLDTGKTVFTEWQVPNLCWCCNFPWRPAGPFSCEIELMKFMLTYKWTCQQLKVFWENRNTVGLRKSVYLTL